MKRSRLLCMFALSLSFATFSCVPATARENVDPCAFAAPGDGDLQLKLYPNPFRTTLELDMSGSTGLAAVDIRFLNLLGKEMDIHVNLPFNNTNNHIELDLKQLPSGVYFMEISARTTAGMVNKYTRRITKI